jgi:hypothetical protein
LPGAFLLLLTGAFLLLLTVLDQLTKTFDGHSIEL